MAIKYLATGRIQGTTAERNAMTTSSTVTTNTSWKEVGRGTVTGSTATSIATGTFTAKDNYMIMFHIIADGSTVTKLHFNDDNSDGNYQKADSDNGAGNSIENGIDTLTGIHKTTAYQAWGYGYIRNKLDGSKRLQIYSMKNNATGVSGTLEHRKYFGSWNPDTATDRITKMTMTAGGATLGVGTEILVLGMDDDEADSGTNYWQQIGKNALTSSSDDLDVTIASPKKYMMVNYHAIPSGAIDIAGRCGISGSVATTDSFYTKQECDNWGTFGSSAQADILAWGKGSGGSYDAQGWGYMVNKDGSEKMWLSTGQDNGGDGASGVGAVRENSGKFVTTSGQVNIFRLIQYGGGGYGDMASGTECTVWGGN